MNVWKITTVFSTFALVLVVGYQAASARPADPSPNSIAGDYRRMRSAIEHLRIARDHLANAEHNHGGWRERALEATDHAIHETEEAIRWNP
ncbi:MAG: hypothetical protein ABSC94_03570 [Polyangiaceae bacterium]|jgi:hypothetical protein